MKKSLIIGRFQGFHDGHAALIEDALKRIRVPVVAIRDCPFDEKNPFTIHERRSMIHSRFTGLVETIAIPDIDEVIYGRTPGWSLRQVEVPEGVAAISGTSKRKGFLGDNGGSVIWITGNTGHGKSTLARALRPLMLPCVILDGDDIRETLSSDLGFSLEDRLEQNRRIAQLAKAMSRQVNVIVAVIAPTANIRKMISEIIDPIWFYVSRGRKPTENTPYEKPHDVSAYVVDPTLRPADAASYVFEKIKLETSV